MGMMRKLKPKEPHAMKPKRERKKMGRPALPADVARHDRVTIRITRGERQRLDAEAKRLGVSLADVLMQPWRNPKEA